MEPRHSFADIHLDEFNKLLADYPIVVLPKLSSLDHARYDTIPTTLAEGKTHHEDAPSLQKSELVTLVEWKLSHGTFRPSLKKLVESNSEDSVAKCTAKGFGAFDPTLDEQVSGPLKSLSELKGIGPATASLLLSVWDPERAPFFSDELFRWAHHEPKPGKGWDRVIKYTPKEYLDLFIKVTELRQRLDVRAVDAEKVAFVIGRRAVGKSADKLNEATQTTVPKAKRKATDVGEDTRTNVNKATRKSNAQIEPSKKAAATTLKDTTGTRSSARLKAIK